MSMFFTSSQSFFFMIAFTVNYSSGVSSSTYVVVPALEDLWIDICAQRRSFAVVSFQDCAYSCLVQDNCASFFFHSQTLTCQLSITVFSDQDDYLGAYIPGSKYYYLKTWTPALSEINYNTVVDMCIHVHTENASWDDASAICSKEGAHLVTVDTDNKNAYLTNFLKDAQPHANFPYHIGARKRNNNWVWENGAFIQNIYWCGVSDTSKDCMLIRLDQCWTSRICDLKHAFVCEI